MRVSKADGSIADCSGKLRVVGKRHGSKQHKVHGSSCAFVRGPSTTPPPGLTDRQKLMVKQAVAFGIGRANDLIANGSSEGGGFFYYGQMNDDECVWLSATKVRCPIYLWWEIQSYAADFSAIYTTRDIVQSNVFVEDLGTSVGFNTLMEPDSAGFNFNQPYYLLCSDAYVGTTPCPANRFPVQYPPNGPPYPP